MLAPSALLRPQRGRAERSYRVLLKIPRKLNLRPETRISLALACPRINRWSPPRGIDAGDLVCATLCTSRQISGLSDRLPMFDDVFSATCPSAECFALREPSQSGFRKESVVADPQFSPHPSFPRGDCSFLASGWFWKMQIKKGTFARFNLVNGQGLIGSSNNEGVVPNSDAAFTGKAGQDVTRTVEIYGLGAGTAMVGFSPGAGVAATLSMQVEVVPIPGKRPSLVSFSAKTAALNGPGLSTSYQLDFTKSVT